MTAVAELLFLAHRIPYPPNKGDKIRSWHLFEHLARRHVVHLGCFIDDPADRQHEAAVRTLCGDCLCGTLPRSPLQARNAAVLASGEPVTLRHYRRRAMTDFVASVARRRLDGVFVYSSAMAPYALDVVAPRRILDLVDVDSDKWRQYAAQKRPPARWVYAREARTLLAFERRAALAFDASLLVSDNEARLFRELAPEAAARVHALPNGVDLERFSPAVRQASPFDPGEAALVFTGAMDYWANVDAVTWFADAVLPAVRRARQDATFWIVGANPDPAVLRLAERSGVRVTGRVPDTRPYLAHAAAVVAPLRVARGTQNKVLEAMATGRPVVTTTAAAAGVEAARPGRDLLVADAPAAFAAAVDGLLAAPADAAALGSRARRCVERNYSWARSLDRLDELLGLTPDRTQQRQAVAT
jgi:sugar transferase (PEP-CTERM/EpsH1 system associated)